jgi:hypothetical protein
MRDWFRLEEEWWREVYMNSVHKRKAENKNSFLFISLGKKARNKVETMIDAWSRKSRGIFLSLKRRR